MGRNGAKISHPIKRPEQRALEAAIGHRIELRIACDAPE
jgi:hypothetical protein